MNEGTPYEDGIEAPLDGVSMQVVKHKTDALRKDEIGPLTREYVHYCEAWLKEERFQTFSPPKSTKADHQSIVVEVEGEIAEQTVSVWLTLDPLIAISTLDLWDVHFEEVKA